PHTTPATHLTPTLILFLSIPPPPRSTLFPYTTLFRSAALELQERAARLRPVPARRPARPSRGAVRRQDHAPPAGVLSPGSGDSSSEEHTSELQSRGHLVCRLLLEKKKKKKEMNNHIEK